MSQLKIFSYLPNPRVAKATIAARLCGVTVEVCGDSITALQTWLWDFDAHAMTVEEQAAARDLQREGRTGFAARLYKTEAFLDAHPYGTAPAAFSPDGRIGVFESNSILRAVARLGSGTPALYGRDPYTASRIDSFLDTSLLFARDTQLYVLALWGAHLDETLHASARQAFASYLAGIERALHSTGSHIVGDALTLADICFVAELALFHNECAQQARLAALDLQPILASHGAREYPRAFAHFNRLRRHEAFAPDLAPYLGKLIAD